MARLVIVGGGVGGLGAALFAARRGHDVTLVERDADHPTGDAELDFATWRRPGVAQARQPHVLLGLARRVLAEEAPDVLLELLASGPALMMVPPAIAGSDDPEDAVLAGLGVRRITFEPRLRAAVEAEPRVQMLAGLAVDGLVTDGERVPGAPHVIGVRTGEGVIEADLVVDAGGRRSALPAWLAELDARAPADEVHDLRLSYSTRWYRLPSGAEAPTMLGPHAVDLGYGLAMAFPGDGGSLALTVTLDVDDPVRARLRDPEVFDAVAAELAHVAPWLARGAKPSSEVLLMARLENRARRLVDARGPVATGVAALGDAAVFTNPTLGRGAALALAGAQHVASTADMAHDDPVAFAIGFDAWTAANLSPWFTAQVVADARRHDVMRASLDGRTTFETEADRRLRAATRAAATDPVVARALGSVQHLLRMPGVLEEPDVRARIDRTLGDPEPAAVPAMSRQRLLAIAGVE